MLKTSAAIMKRRKQFNKGMKYIKLLRTCPSAMITRTWYCPLLFSTMSIAASIIGANEVGPIDVDLKIISINYLHHSGLSSKSSSQRS